jgi:hypothetical protein
MKRLMFVVVCGFTASIAAQPTPQKFEVASVKRNYVPDLLQRTRITLTPGRWDAVGRVRQTDSLQSGLQRSNGGKPL